MSAHPEQFIKHPPETLCLVRLSAIGDVTHTLPVINTIKSNWPQTQISWVIGKTEHTLVRDVPDIEWLVMDKSRGLRAYCDIRKQLAARQFDLLLLMQLSLRANLVPLLACRSRNRLGFDRARARDFHSLITNLRIPARKNEHVLDSFLGFTDALGMTRNMVWNHCYDKDDEAFARKHLEGKRNIVISPCSSHSLRDWAPQRYAAVADYAAQHYGAQVVLTGGNSAEEVRYAKSIPQAMHEQPLNLIGKTTLRQLVALIAYSDIVICPDSGPAHIATCVDTPVIGLYAATNPKRAAPYLSKDWCVDRYADAARKWCSKDVRALRWGTKIERKGVMDLIAVDDVIDKLNQLAASLAWSASQSR